MTSRTSLSALSRLQFVFPFVLGGILACAAGCRFVLQNSVRGARTLRDSPPFESGRRGPLTKEEQNWSKIAWKYFQNNYQPGTGLVSSTDKGNTATMWTAGDTLAAIYVAHHFKLIDDRDFNLRLTALLNFLNQMPLAAGALPNRVYRTDSGAPVDAKAQPGMSGWSALDIGRLLLWLRLARRTYPSMAEYFDKSVLRWDICRALDASGTLYSGALNGSEIETSQDGRLGYEEYAAQGFQSWGFTTRQASRIEPFTKTRILGVQIYYDSRDERSTGVYAPVLSLPYLLYGMELDWDPIEREYSNGKGESYRALAQNIYRVQEARYVKLGILTARTDHASSRSPYYVYDSIFASGYPWNTISTSGQRASTEALVATQAVFPMWVLWKTRYTDALENSVRLLYDPDRGWYEGRFEKTGGAETVITARTNAMVLEALDYQLEGRLFHDAGDIYLFRTEVDDPFNGTAACISVGKAPKKGRSR